MFLGRGHNREPNYQHNYIPNYEHNYVHKRWRAGLRYRPQ